MRYSVRFSLHQRPLADGSFVVSALRLGIPAEVIMSWTGHRDHKSMRPYIAIVDDLKAENMKKFNSLI